MFVSEKTGIIIRCFQFPLRICQLLLLPSALCGLTNTHKARDTHTPAPTVPECHWVWPRCEWDVIPPRMSMTCSTRIWHLLLLLSLSFFCVSPRSQVKKKFLSQWSYVLGEVLGDQVLCGYVCASSPVYMLGTPWCHSFKRSRQTKPHTCLAPFSFSLYLNTPCSCKVWDG